MLTLPLAVSLALVFLPLAQETPPETTSKPHRPTVKREGDRLVFQPEKDASIAFSLRNFRVAEVEANGRSVRPRADSEPGYKLSDSPAAAKAVNWTIVGQDIVFDIKIGDEAAPLAATERVSVACLNGVLGYTRRVHVTPPAQPAEPTALETRILEFGAGELGQAPKVTEHLEHYGHSTVSKPGVTYTVHSYERKDGQRVWVFRSGLHLLNQALNPGMDPALVEAVFVEPKGASAIDRDALLAAYVEVPEDRRALLPKRKEKRVKVGATGDKK